MGDEYVHELTETKYKTVPIRGKDVKFNAMILNEFLGTPNCDSVDFNTLKDKPPYRDIRPTLCGIESTARWKHSKDTGRHNTLHFANYNQVARVWLKIVCSVLLPAKHLTKMFEEIEGPDCNFVYTSVLGLMLMDDSISMVNYN
ncbi:hypothetical protein H5410_057339 [Solanum commersonii]|uniref:Putative plant transposon protein domain-containing protein n=1 Tax=Solanum commersonii TaxID=4109 RepID=A0A9J5WPE1_SOLCO|nr:hypothetical protein H5410_057339 [Solanum commersonii]